MSNKDPAFLFYTSDFLTGTILMSNEEVGKYIRLLCLQHQKGHLSRSDMLKVCGEENEEIFSKFSQDKNGFFFNERLEKEVKKRRKHSDRQRENVMKRWNRNASDGIPKDIPKEYDGNTTVLPLENENEDENEIVNKIDFIFFKETYNRECNNLSSMKVLTEKRKTAIRKFLKEFTPDQFAEICCEANKSDFLIGKNDRGWRADFDFIIRTDKAASVLEGKYDSKERSSDNERPKSKYKLECLEL